MKRTTIALTAAYKILKWFHERGVYCRLECSVFTSNNPKPTYKIDVKGNSFKDVHALKKQFKMLGKFTRKQWIEDEPKLTYDTEKEFNDGWLRIHIYAVKELPPHCKIVTKQVLIPEQVIEPEERTVIEEHYETKIEVVCNGEKEQAIHLER